MKKLNEWLNGGVKYLGRDINGEKMYSLTRGESIRMILAIFAGASFLGLLLKHIVLN